MAKSHPAVKDPRAWERKAATKSDRFIKWLTDRVLASALMFYAALILPLLVLPMSDGVKLILAVVSSNWIQWWALPALQRSANKADEERALKAEADHETLVHVATKLDRLESILLHPSQQEPPLD